MDSFAISSRLLDWYWTHADQRIPGYQLSPSGWLDRLYGLDRQARKTARPGERPCIGIWGPSQSGKSTLLAQYIDADADPEGRGSALDWPGGIPGRFRAGCEHGVGLNPYNQGSDASGCVTRYHLCQEVKHPRFPVRIHFSTLTELLHSLAAGYLSECRLENADGETVFWTRDSLLAGLAKEGLDVTGDSRPVPASRDGFEAMLALCDVIGLLISAGEQRYKNLNANGSWREIIRPLLLNAAEITADPNKVWNLAALVLWDKRKTLTALFENLRRKHGDFTRLANGKNLYCTLEAAGILLDINAVDNFLNPPNDFAASRASRIRDWKLQTDGDDLLIGADSGPLLLKENIDLGYFQAMTREIVIPLHPTPSMPPAFLEVMTAADLLDFPGVALKSNQTAEENQLDGDRVDLFDPRLFTQVLKRGKTASIVTSYALDGAIDAFILMSRLGRFPAQPRQIRDGFRLWWQSVAPGYDFTSPEPPPLPLFLVLTFGGKLISDVLTSFGQVGNGLLPLFAMLDALDPLPQKALTFATTYKIFPDGSFIFPNSAQGGALSPEQEQDLLAKARDNIMADKDFQKQFRTPESRRSFQEMVAAPDGGCHYLFQQLAGHLDPARRQELEHQLREQSWQLLQDLLEAALPTAAKDADRRNAALRKIHDATRAACHRQEPFDYPGADAFSDPSGWIAGLIRQLQDINPETIDIPPAQLGNQAANLKGYLHRQILRIRDKLPAVDATAGWPYRDLGMDTPADTRQFLACLQEAADLDQLRVWMIERFYQHQIPITTRMRSCLATAISNVVWEGTMHNTRKPDADVQTARTRLEFHADQERDLALGNPCDREQTAYYRQTVAPFLERIQTILVAGTASQRPDFPGDDTLAALKHDAAGQSQPTAP